MCTYFCQLDAWTNEGIACGLNIPAVDAPSFTEPAEELQQLAQDAGERVDQVWISVATTEFSVDDISPPDYGSESIIFLLFLRA